MSSIWDIWVLLLRWPRLATAVLHLTQVLPWQLEDVFNVPAWFIRQAIRVLSKRAPAGGRNIKDKCPMEEATKMSLIVPFFQALGWDVFNPEEFLPAIIAGVANTGSGSLPIAYELDGHTPELALVRHTCPIYARFVLVKHHAALLENLHAALKVADNMIAAFQRHHRNRNVHSLRPPVSQRCFSLFIRLFQTIVLICKVFFYPSTAMPHPTGATQGWAA